MADRTGTLKAGSAQADVEGGREARNEKEVADL